jgi:hypothetical protein
VERGLQKHRSQLPFRKQVATTLGQSPEKSTPMPQSHQSKNSTRRRQLVKIEA